MTGNDLIKAILDNGQGEEEIRVVGLNEEGNNIDDTSSAAISEVTAVDMEDGQTVSCIVIEAEIAG